MAVIVKYFVHRDTVAKLEKNENLVSDRDSDSSTHKERKAKNIEALCVSV